MTPPTPDAPKGFMPKLLDVVEKVGNKVPHPAVIFLILIGLVVLCSAVLNLGGAGVSYEVLVPYGRAADAATPAAVVPDTGTTVTYQTVDEQKYKLEARTLAARSLLTGEGVRFMYTSLIPSFMGFTGLGLMIVAMVGAGVAEESGLVNALIRKLVLVSPRWAMTYILAFVGILSSVAADAGYLVLIPLAGTAFLSLGRHPLAGLALGFAAVAGAFTVNMLIKPLDAVLVEFTNDAIHLVDPNASIGLTANVWFSVASVVMLTFLVAVITERVIEPRLGRYTPAPDAAGASEPAAGGGGLSDAESRGLRYALFAALGLLAVFAVLTLPAGAPLRNPDTGALIGNTPFMNGLIALIMLAFLATGAAYGAGAGTMTSLTAVIKSIEKTLSGMGGLIFLFLLISQFVAYFNFSNVGTILAVSMANVLKGGNIDALWLLLGFIAVVLVVDLLITGAIAKWAIFAPIFVPLLMKLGVAPEAVLAAYRVGDSPVNSITPLNAYFALVVGFAQRYDKAAGVGTVVALMLPYVAGMTVVWVALFVAWYLLGLPWGL